jgi:hypothetical protein
MGILYPDKLAIDHTPAPLALIAVPGFRNRVHAAGFGAKLVRLGIASCIEEIHVFHRCGHVDVYPGDDLDVLEKHCRICWVRRKSGRGRGEVVFHPETEELIVRLRKSGRTQEEIAAGVGITRHQVRKILRRHSL